MTTTPDGDEAVAYAVLACVHCSLLWYKPITTKAIMEHNFLVYPFVNFKLLNAVYNG
jgi:hypothetical protein